MELSRVLPFAEDAAAQQLAFFRPMWTDISALCPPEICFDEMFMFDCSPSTTLKQIASTYDPSVSWSVTEPTVALAVTEQAWKSHTNEAVLDEGYSYQDDVKLNLMDIFAQGARPISFMEDDMLDIQNCIDSMEEQGTTKTLDLTESSMLSPHLARTETLFSLSAATENPCNQHSGQNVATVLKTNHSASYGSQQENMHSASDFTCSQPFNDADHLTSHLSNEILGFDRIMTSQEHVQVMENVRYVDDKFLNSPVNYYPICSISPTAADLLLSECIRAGSPIRVAEEENLQDAHSSSSVVSSSVITDTDTDCSVHSGKLLTWQYGNDISTKDFTPEELFTSSWRPKIVKDSLDQHNRGEAAPLQPLDSLLKSCENPSKRSKGCFTLDAVSESVNHHLQQLHHPRDTSKASIGLQKFQQQKATHFTELNHMNSKSASSQTSLPWTVESADLRNQYRPPATSIEPQSIAARQRRKKISERVSTLEKLVPGGSKLDTASMLDEAIKYVKFLQVQVQIMQSIENDEQDYNPSAPIAYEKKRKHGRCRSAAHSEFSFTTSPQSKSSSASPLVLTEVLQHQLFKSGYCISQCPKSQNGLKLV
ncbi:hypothetical protein O6H91_09G056800 [Diphasiastrum complanatum]|uniref:Uncharacterized protein n=1 Tax=Diphasiastrum complanatum TaxID=34168 RepID=A0ACC2CPC2_DIPCM|nr:hypothetical protein O6H91_09G056800 [Diphasiastrum complanatum]